ncbi:MAG: Spy/CpxP family protein refolding chaperone [Proteobacteria bacterium]|nr:Spy/CpxP family protein refolding chaperone [Pseudomonadota bacterium]
MKKQKVVGIMLVMFMVLAAGTATLAHMYGMGPGPLRALMELDLSDAQKAQIAAIMAASKAERKTAKQKHKEVRDILAPVLKAEAFNEESVRAAFRQASALMEDIMVIRVRIGNQIRAVLTDEQRQLMEEQREKGIAGMKKHAGFRETLLNTWLQTTSE